MTEPQKTRGVQRPRLYTPMQAWRAYQRLRAPFDAAADTLPHDHPEWRGIQAVCNVEIHRVIRVIKDQMGISAHLLFRVPRAAYAAHQKALGFDARFFWVYSKGMYVPYREFIAMFPGSEAWAQETDMRCGYRVNGMVVAKRSR